MSEDEDFRRDFPALNKELEEGNTRSFKIDGVRTMSDESTESKEEKIAYTPDVVAPGDTDGIKGNPGCGYIAGSGHPDQRASE